MPGELEPWDGRPQRFVFVCARRVLLLGVLAGVLVCAAFAAPASALTWGAYGHGTLSISGAGAPACTTPATAAGSVFTACTSTGFELCTPPEIWGYVCSVTITATAPAGWRFDRWEGSGDDVCSGTSATCDLITFVHSCNDADKPPCQDVSYTVSARARFVDIRTPSTTFSAAPGEGSVVVDGSAAQTFSWSTDENDEGPIFECRRDTQSFAGCSSSLTWSDIPDGVHEFCVKATDPSGHSSVACRRWDQELPPTVGFDSRPSDGSTISTPTASFMLTSNKEGRIDGGASLTYRCSLDGAPAFDCPRAYTTPALQPGTHRLTVRASFHAPFDAPGGTHAGEPVTTTWIYADSKPPSVTFLAPTPPEGTIFTPDTPQDTFAFAADEPVTFSCRMDAGAYAPCSTSPCSTTCTTTRVVANGAHTFWVLATDRSGNPTEIARHFVQSTRPPDTTIVAGPAEGLLTNDRGVTFILSSSQRATTLQCSLDAAAFADCQTTTSYADLTDGEHTFEARAVDAAGNVDPTPVSRRWRITSDLDQDLFVAPADCNDSDPTIHPGAAEILDNAVDEDCDGVAALNLDRDGDGFARAPGPDCDDSRATTHPGARDLPQNKLDEDCDDIDAPYPRLGASLRATFAKNAAGRLIFTTLTVANSRAGIRVVVTCSRSGCPFKQRTARLRTSRRTRSLMRLVRGVKFRARTQLEVRLSLPDTVGVLARWSGRRPRRTDMCLPPPQLRPQRCGTSAPRSRRGAMRRSPGQSRASASIP